MKNDSLTSQVHLTLSATYPNLQHPVDIITILDSLEEDYPDTFRWAGEINVFKHALAANGFFVWPRVDTDTINVGALDPFFHR